ncbi:DUF5696 domain-containing protein [Cohnella yongneupensis]|uniref:DUF5696 domain-containing protein n=1 Tax=Cohnella yongneupensis TaxID=425006 RepID=A0ABW0R728_9BACL
MNKRIVKPAALLLLIVLIGGYAYFTYKHQKGSDPDSTPAVVAEANGKTGGEAANVAFDSAAWEQNFPSDADFQEVARTDALTLKADPKTGHFIVADNRNGIVWRSYPDPKDWDKETIQGVWRNHLRSPLMYETVDLNKKNLPPTELSNLIQDKGAITGWQKIEAGFRLTFVVPSKGLSIPVEVRIRNDYVETKIVDSALKESKVSLVNLRIYPFFGAEQSTGQDGYLFVPDGSGALIRFNPDRIKDNSVYYSRVYGTDYTFSHNNKATFHQQVTLPVFGLKSADSGFVAVVQEGAEYASLFASPSGSYSQYNWITAEMNYRLKYRQITLKGQTPEEDKGFDTYNADRFGSDRTVRYYLLDKGKSDYSGMAERFRRYLMEDQGLVPLKKKSDSVPMYIGIMGGDTEHGFLGDRYVPGTKVSDAMQMVQKLYGLGIDNMSVTYLGWKQGGISSLGGQFPVDDRLGGNKAMRQFIQYAGTLGVPVYLEGQYLYNNSGDDGFKSSKDGLRDLGQSVVDDLVSPLFMKSTINDDLPLYKELGAAGVYYSDGMGYFLNSDYNVNHPVSRMESRQIQEELLKQTKSTVGGVQLYGASLYALGSVDHIMGLADDYSYDLFVDEQVPFAEMSLHGLVTYSFGFSNQWEQFKQSFLRSIEYGAVPSYLFSAASGEELKYTKTLSDYYSPSVSDWEQSAVADYQRYNDALGDVQDQFISSHRKLSENVYETTFAGGKKVIVNYNAEPYSDGAVQVAGEDFVVINGGARP